MARRRTAMAARPWTYKEVADALFSEGLTPNDDAYEDVLAAHIKQTFNLNESQMDLAEVQVFLSSFTERVKKYWRAPSCKSRKNKFFSAHKPFFQRVVDFSSLPIPHDEDVPDPQEHVTDPPGPEAPIQEEPESMEVDVVQKIKSWSGKGRTQQWRDKKKTLQSGTPNCILSAAAQSFYDRGEKAAGYVLKELIKDPIGTGKNF